MFLIVVALIVAIAHYYFWRRLARDVADRGRWRRVSAVAFVIVAVTALLGLSLSRWIGPDRARPLSWTGGIWAGVTFFLLMLLLAVDAVRGVGWLARRAAKAAPTDPDRRRFLARVVAGGAGAAAVGMSGVAVASGAGAPQVVRVEIPIRGLPKAFERFRIVQLSDLHIGPILGREFLADVVARTNALEPDMVAITGDLVDGSVSDLADAVAPLADLRARHGVFFVTGNHEYYSGVAEWLAHLGRLRIRVLRNERVAVEREGVPIGASIDVAGVDDASASRFGAGHGADPDAALSGRDPARPVVLLAHQPKQVFDAQRHGVNLVLAGHTHGGQVFPFGLFVRLVQPAVRGLHRFGKTWLYVSCGTGSWGPPMRLGAAAEITVLELTAEREAAP